MCELVFQYLGIMCEYLCVDVLYAVKCASDQSPLTAVSSSSPEPTLDSQGGESDDITSYKTWMKFLPDSEAQAKDRLSPEIPLVCPTPIRGDSFIVLNFICLLLASNFVVEMISKEWMYTVSQKMSHFVIFHIFAKYQLIFRARAGIASYSVY